MISRTEERERAARWLGRCSAKTLASFILTLLDAPHGVGEYVEAFIASEEPARAVGLIDSQIAALGQADREYDWRHRRGSSFVARCGLLLDAIETIVLPVDAAATVQLLERFYEREAQVVDGSFDDEPGLSRLFERAAQLFQRAGAGLPVLEVEPIRLRLLARDDYGWREPLRVADP